MNADDAFWADAERSRRRELRAQNVSKGIARHVAAFETRIRRKMEGVVGRQAAATAEIRLEFRSDGTYSAWLAILPSSIPPEFLARAEAWAAGPTGTSH